jgi:hypothetical protein
MKAIYELRMLGKVITQATDFEGYEMLVQRAVGIVKYEEVILGKKCDFINPEPKEQGSLKTSERLLDRWSNGMSIVKVDTYIHHLNADQYMHVKMDKYYTATVRCLRTFEFFIINNPFKKEVILDIKHTSVYCPDWFVQGVKKLIDKYRNDKFFERYNKV